MSESFGARLRQQRERRQIDLARIAEQTKIKKSLLEALERDDVSYWPTGIFRRAFIRSYAQAIGLAPDPLVREFLEIYPDPIEEAAAMEAALEQARGNDPPQTRFRRLIGAAFASLGLRRAEAAPPPRLIPERRQPAASIVTTAVVVSHEPEVRLETEPIYEDAPAVSIPEPAIVQETSIEKMEEPETIVAESIVAEEPLPDTAPPVSVTEPPVPSERDLLAAAELCAAFGRAERTHDLSPLLEQATKLLDATGVIVWAWDQRDERLSAAWAHGYSDELLAQLPTVARDANNATASAFRSAQPRTVAGSSQDRAALVVPLIAAHGPMGVLAIELADGREKAGWVNAMATMFAAQLARIVEEPPDESERPVAVFDRDIRIHRERQALSLAAR